jgi:DNA-binding MarR family transcriptional regulator/GNAT superfamily N-acetyltransferase
MEILSKIGKIALGSRLRLLTAKITEDAGNIYELYGVDLVPKWFPVFYILSEIGETTITEIAKGIGHSQPSVSKIIREMNHAGLVQENRKSKDKRKNVVSLTKKGIGFVKKIQEQYNDVDSAIEGIIGEARHNLWEAIGEWEFLLEQKSLYHRVLEQKKLRESKELQIVDYEDKYHSTFRVLNEEWITTCFEMEDVDYKALNNPRRYILDNGGEIVVALHKNEPVGVCALIKLDDPIYDYELAKMAVSPKMQGKNIGFMLGKAILDKARKLGASKIYLESNTILKPAINLYHKLGFKKVVGHSTPYKRCNIQMELILES